MNEFQSLESLLARFRELGTRHVYCKLLAENDNSKQQIYLGGSFEVLKLLVFGTIEANTSVKYQNFKARMPLSWIDAQLHVAEAHGAQLILYPQYPEVRLSGFIKGCPLAPGNDFQPIPKADRRFNNGPDGRVLFLAVAEKMVFAYLARADSAIAKAIHDNPPRAALLDGGTLREVGIGEATDAREELIRRLSEIHRTSPHLSMRLDRYGNRVTYTAPNGGGYTLEALLDIVPNGRSAPDFMGWELKAYSGSRITLMTPEPNAGFYGQHGVEAFLRKYGRRLPGDTIYFTGSHKVGVRSQTSGHTLVIEGFDASSAKLKDVGGGIRLLDSAGDIAAEWTFSGLVEHWGRKHAAVAYVPYAKTAETPPHYYYRTPVLLGEGTEFALFLQAMVDGAVIYDPAPKLVAASGPLSRTKARSQFRISTKNLASLYRKFEAVLLDTGTAT
ncbi:MvaI/BcnI family restriction endonuclease [Caballeronia sp. ATUFL_F2_KS9A]|uniref:MvaI/BcnI family restriction endonuclease n=1 Tax=Caballeronia sp. ATUFL_F2_KS9A TaxID=2921777 RepID=UPI00202875DC|nr:MvaI/BcnI family restriction endonuclease [Caballeronia sp. ATUFL_F2_KS9A]